MSNGIRYQELRGGKGRGLGQNSGCLVATEVSSNRELWVLKVYEVTYRPEIEADKQEVYFTRLTLDQKRSGLIIENERQERYAVSLSDRTVKRL